MNLTKAVDIVLIAASLAAAGLYTRVPAPQVAQPPFLGLFDIRGDLERVTPLYELEGTTVCVLKGSLLDLHGEAYAPGDHAEPVPVDAIGYSAKLNLSGPFNPRSKSVDQQYRDRIGEAAAPASESLPWEDAEVVRRGYWAGRLRQPLPARGPDSEAVPLDTFVLAGVSAAPSDPGFAKSDKASILEDGMRELCSEVHGEGRRHLAVPLMGTGNAGVDREVALHALLSGVNRAAVEGLAPAVVTLVLFPGPTWFGSLSRCLDADEKKELRREQATWLATGEALRRLRENRSPLGTELRAWSYQRPYYWFSQLFSLVACVALSTRLALLDPSLPVRLTPGAVLSGLFKWGVLAAGFVGFAKGGFQFWAPMDTAPFVVATLAALVLPYADWKKWARAEDR